MEKVRVRFAPSPTGPLHLGGVRTALYDYLFAKHFNGDFVLRIEDTDTQRFVPGAEDYLMESLEWIGITPDESPLKGGPYGPYRQSERRSIYDQYKDQILQSGFAYLAFDTPEELDKIRKEYEAKGQVFAYNYESRQHLRNSTSLSEEEVQKLVDAKTPYVIRFKMPFNQTVHLSDIVRGDFTVNTNTLDDKVLVKTDGMPTYHFANIVDDHEMKISHVIRGEEWLPSLALHILLYQAMGWEAPQFAHLPLILKPEGKGKLSKRDGDTFGFPVFPLSYKDPETGNVSPGYREEGYLPEAFINMVALLGWSPADDKEILSLQEMSKEFDLHKVHKAGARFSIEKAKWFNAQYLQLKSDEDILPVFQKTLQEQHIKIEDAKALQIIGLMKERATFIKDIFDESHFLFKAPEEFQAKSVKRAWKPDTSDIMKNVAKVLNQSDFSTETLNTELHLYGEQHEIGMGKIMMPLRLVLVGELKGPGVPDILNILGKEESISRIQYAVHILG